MSELLILDSGFLEAYQKNKDIHRNFDTLWKAQQQESDQLLKLQQKVISLAKELGVSVEPVENILDANIQSSSQ